MDELSKLDCKGIYIFQNPMTITDDLISRNALDIKKPSHIKHDGFIISYQSY